jgi:lysophospholipase L1-like esterase
VIGESTVAGLGARTHTQALAGRFAEQLRGRLGRSVRWHVIGRNGVTAKRTIDELVPMMPDEKFDYILVGLGGNDVMKLSSPRKWRRDMSRLLGILRERNPDAVIFITNCPMIKYSPALPQPIRFLLWELSKMHDANIREFTSDMTAFSTITSRPLSGSTASSPTAYIHPNRATPMVGSDDEIFRDKL